MSRVLTPRDCSLSKRVTSLTYSGRRGWEASLKRLFSSPSKPWVCHPSIRHPTHPFLNFWATLSEGPKISAGEIAHRTDPGSISNVSLALRAAAQGSLTGWQSLPPPSTPGPQTLRSPNSFIHALQDGPRMIRINMHPF